MDHPGAVATHHPHGPTPLERAKHHSKLAITVPKVRAISIPGTNPFSANSTLNQTSLRSASFMR